MKIVALSDTHGLHHSIEVPDGDVLIVAGDWSRSSNVDNFQGVKAEAEDFANWLKNMPHKHKIIVAGNHDVSLQSDHRELVIQRIESMGGAHYLEDQCLVIDGIKFYGSPWTPAIGGEWAFEQNRSDSRNKWRVVPSDTDVLITHGPPRSILDKTRLNDSCGDHALWGEVTFRIMPALHIFGHIHEGYGMVANQDTTFANVAQLDADGNLRENAVVEIELNPEHNNLNKAAAAIRRSRYNH